MAKAKKNGKKKKEPELRITVRVPPPLVGDTTGAALRETHDGAGVTALTMDITDGALCIFEDDQITTVYAPGHWERAEVAPIVEEAEGYSQ